MVSVDSLCSCELFAGLDAEELAQIAAIAGQETYQAGDLICAEREVADRLFILCEGRVEVRVRLHSSFESGGEMTIEEVEPGCVFGWSSLVKQRRFTASARALTSARHSGWTITFASGYSRWRASMCCGRIRACVAQ